MHGVQNFVHLTNQIRTPSKNKTILAKSIHTPYKIFADHAKNFAHPNQFHTCAKPKGVCEVISHTMRNPRGTCENEESLTHFFLNPPYRPFLHFFILQTLSTLRIPHFPLPSCNLTLLHSIPSPVSISFRGFDIAPP